MEIPKLPDEIIEHLRQIQDTAEDYQWQVGDFLVGVVDELEGVYSSAGVKRARTWLVRHMANRIGAEESTLRDRECVARFFPQDVRDEYPFSWSQWRALKSAGDHWREYADWAADNLPAPVSLIRQKIKGNGHQQPSWVYKFNKAMDYFEDISADEEAPIKVRSFSEAAAKIRPIFASELKAQAHK